MSTYVFDMYQILGNVQKDGSVNVARLLIESQETQMAIKKNKKNLLNSKAEDRP